ncbi:MAG TPA: carboxypeptidase regulatory-like domain-containing protein [Verrucomicrobiae bacterium]|nr:carboxypeptidase regulatory-like domain-containing protein [Verrucomicrobiae bacterium]
MVESAAVRQSEGLKARNTVYSIGDPSPEEQLYLELINRARANPLAEGLLLANTSDSDVQQNYAYWGVNLAAMQAQFAIIPPAPPLAMNAQLTDAARNHSLDMFNNVYQGHIGVDGSNPGTRIKAAGYNYRTYGENVFANAQSVFHGHAAFEVDYGPGTDGMQTPPGHRESIHTNLFMEVGIGVKLGHNENATNQVGPMVVTQDFGTILSASPFITGVAYYDLNGNNFYDLGEGIGGVTVTVTGSNSQGITARSGGYAVPVPGNGTYSVTFSGGGFAALTRTVTISGGQSQKLDFLPSYATPMVNGSSIAAVNRLNDYTISVVPGAAAYEWRDFQTSQAATEGAENGSNKVIISQTGQYAVIENTLKKSGAFAFHLATPGEKPVSQYVTLTPNYLVGANASITFQSKLGWSDSDQHARVQISQDGGGSWQTIDNQDGNSTSGQSTFAPRTVGLTNFVGQQIQVRFGFEFASGDYYPATDTSYGWVFDDIQFANVQEVTNEQITDTAATSFQFLPTQTGSFILQARAKTGHDFLPWGPMFGVRTLQPTGAPVFHLTGAQRGGGQLILGFVITAGAAPASFTLESKASLGDGWSPETAAAQPVDTMNYRFSVPVPGGGRRFYRVRAN